MPDTDSRGAARHSRRWFLKGLLGTAGLAVAAKGADELLPLTLCRPGEWHGPVTDHFNGTHFFNKEGNRHSGSGTKNLIAWLTRRHEKGVYPDVSTNAYQPQLAPEVNGRAWEITMVNHSTMLIRLAGLNVLTDPIWSDYTSPIQGFGPKRHRPVGITWEELPRIDICLLSHDHYDHFDVDTLQRLTQRDNPLYVVPLGLKSLLVYHCGHVRCEELDWWQNVTYRGLRITLTPARHWSNRYRGRETSCRSLWGGFWLQALTSVYYSGDTSQTRWFQEIYARLGAPDVALLPIGAYQPDWIRNNHLNPADAVEAMLQLHARRAIACHFGTWQLANEGYQQTLDDLATALKRYRISPELFLAPDNGQTLSSSAL